MRSLLIAAFLAAPAMAGDMTQFSGSGSSTPGSPALAIQYNSAGSFASIPGSAVGIDSVTLKALLVTYGIDVTTLNVSGLAQFLNTSGYSLSASSSIYVSSGVVAAWFQGNGAAISGVVASSLASTLNVAGGGTGATTLTTNGVLFGNGTSAVGALPAMGVAGVVIGNGTSLRPSTATLTGTLNQVSVSTGVGTVTLSLPQSIHTGATPTFGGMTLSGALGMGSNLINNVTDPASAQDAATMAYVLAQTNDLDMKAGGHWATTTALPSNNYSNGSSGVNASLIGVSIGFLNIDGGTPGLNERVLVKNEADPTHNGLYRISQNSSIAVYILVRTTDHDQAAEMGEGVTIPIDSGTVNGCGATCVTFWSQTSSVTTVGTTPVVFAQANGLGDVSAGNGISITASNGSNLISLTSTVTVQGNAFSVGASTFIVSSGRVGIGTTSPGYLLNISSGNAAFNYGVVASSIVVSGSNGSLISTVPSSFTATGNSQYSLSASSGINVTNDVVVGGAVRATANIIAGGKFIGDGSLLTGVSSGVGNSTTTVLANTEPTFANTVNSFGIDGATVTVATSGTKRLRYTVHLAIRQQSAGQGCSCTPLCNGGYCDSTMDGTTGYEANRNLDGASMFVQYVTTVPASGNYTMGLVCMASGGNCDIFCKKGSSGITARCPVRLEEE